MTNKHLKEQREEVQSSPFSGLIFAHSSTLWAHVPLKSHADVIYVFKLMHQLATHLPGYLHVKIAPLHQWEGGGRRREEVTVARGVGGCEGAVCAWKTSIFISSFWEARRTPQTTECRIHHAHQCNVYSIEMSVYMHSQREALHFKWTKSNVGLGVISSGRDFTES